MLLRGLKSAVADGELGDLTAVVTVADDGGSSGRLRRDFGVLPPGDIRSCLVAMAEDEDLMARLFDYRFTNGDGLSGHSFGNLFLTAMAGVTGNFYDAVVTAEQILSVRGRILPSALADVHLRARGASGEIYEGESAVGEAQERLVELALEPRDVVAFPAAARALRQAALVVLGPGSIYTSIVPNLLIPGIREAIAETEAQVVMPLNLMTQPGETDGMSASDHLQALRRYGGDDLVDVVLVNDTPFPEEVLTAYRRDGAEPVGGLEELAAHGVEVVRCDLVAAGDLVRHDSAKLAAALLRIGSGA